MAKEKKTKKHDTFIDMTAMSDMTVLLLTFFMLTATFLPLEPVQVITPQSVSETKIPEYNSMMILIDPSGRVFLNVDAGEQKGKLLEAMGTQYNIKFTAKQMRAFQEDATFAAVPMNMMPSYLDLDGSERNAQAKKHGIPMDTLPDSPKNQLAAWVRQARAINKDITISIKADQTTEYAKVDKVMKVLVDIKENRYSLVTSLTGMPDGF